MKLKRHIPLFLPLVTEDMKQAAYAALGEKTIGQGKKVDEFEEKINRMLGTKNLVTVNSGTSALELAYHLLNLKPGDEVITPVFTCTATNIPLLRKGVKIVFADIKDNLLMDWDDVAKKITTKTKAIVNVHLFGQLNETRKLFSIPVVGDAAQFFGKTSGEKFTIYSFQATKLLTTVDGGALVCQHLTDYHRAKLLRWYGINRETKRDNIDVDFTEAGYKYHMNNVTATIGIAGLRNLSKLKKQLDSLQASYWQQLKDIPEIKAEGGSPFLIHVPNRNQLTTKLAQFGIETGLGHLRNDIYSAFGGKRQHLPKMNLFEKSYLLLPCRANMTLDEVDFVCEVLRNEFA